MLKLTRAREINKDMIESMKNLNVNEQESRRESNKDIKTSNYSIKAINDARTITWAMKSTKAINESIKWHKSNRERKLT